jgi:hypothetical protein
MEHARRAVGAHDGSPVFVNRKQPATGQTPKQASARLVQGPVPIAAKQCQSIPTKFGGAACPTVVRTEKLGAVIDEKLPAMMGDAGMLPSVMKALDTHLPIRRDATPRNRFSRCIFQPGGRARLHGDLPVGSGPVHAIWDGGLAFPRIQTNQGVS